MKRLEVYLDVPDVDEFDLPTFLYTLKTEFLSTHYSYIRVSSGKVLSVKKSGDD